jgi:hypothetical protein
VVIFTKSESRHASIACKTQEPGMTVSFIICPLAETHLTQKDATTTERSSGFQGLGGGVLNKHFAIRPGLHCLPSMILNLR